IHNILILGGDDPKLGDQPETKAVYDLDSKSLLATAQAMRTKKEIPSSTKIDGRLELVLGVADLPSDPAPGWKPAGLLAKQAGGADFVQTQFCMDVEVVKRYSARARDSGVTLPLLIGIASIPSARSAR